MSTSTSIRAASLSSTGVEKPTAVKSLAKNSEHAIGAGDYWQLSSQPLVSLVFVAPLLVMYESFLLLRGPEALRNGAEVWLRQLLAMIGFGQYFLLPLLTCGVLIAWHHTTRNPWQVRSRVLAGMSLESVALGALLLGMALVAGSAFRSMHMMPVAVASCQHSGPSLLTRIAGYCGAGIYEELLFRLLLLPAVIGLLVASGLQVRTAVIAGVLSTSLLFSAVHYQFLVAGGDVFQWYSFLFRFLAGLFFAVLMLRRGFGIAAGSHALYDILVALA